MPELHSLLLVLVGCLVTLSLRAFPFILFGGHRKTPPVILYLGRTLPYAVIGMLVVYCMRSTELTSLGGWLPTLVGVLVVAVLHLTFRNTLLSIICGTAAYMLLLYLV